MLQRELHKLLEQSTRDHETVRQELKELQREVKELSDRLGDVEADDAASERVLADRSNRRRSALAWAGGIAAVAGTISGIFVAFIDRI
jgi:hypothetical protein